MCYPVPAPPRSDRIDVRGLYDASLALTLDGPVIGNDVSADGRQLIMVTGANQGGKSTFLRSVGQAQLMLQAGMFAPAQELSGSVCSGIFTHFKRDEDASMERGKLDEELDRMSADGSRTHRLCEAAPLPTSYGEDLYQATFGVRPEATLRSA